MYRIRGLLTRAKLAVGGLVSKGTDEDNMDTQNNEHRILVIGKSGNGKSSLCNTLCDNKLFGTGRGLAVTTRTAQLCEVRKYGRHIQVVDTPDVTNLNMNIREMEEEVARWRQLTHPYPTTVLLAVRCDVRYTAEEHDIYHQIHKLWGDNSLKERLVVAFTFGDRQDNDLEDELRTVCPELKNVLRDAGKHYVMFTNKVQAHENEEQVQRLLTIMDTLPKGGMFPPKYLTVAIPVISGFLCFITYTAGMTGPATFFGGLCLVSTFMILQKMH